METKTEIGEAVEQDKEENTVKDTEGPQPEDNQGLLRVEGGDAVNVATVNTAVVETEVGERHGELGTQEELVELVNEVFSEQQTEEDQIALENSRGKKKENEGEKCFQLQKVCKNGGSSKIVIIPYSTCQQIDPKNSKQTFYNTYIA